MKLSTESVAIMRWGPTVGSAAGSIGENAKPRANQSVLPPHSYLHLLRMPVCHPALLPHRISGPQSVGLMHPAHQIIDHRASNRGYRTRLSQANGKKGYTAVHGQ